jgi:predicted DCC family thiol-disulfide oxidoreductase YuxK
MKVFFYDGNCEYCSKLAQKLQAKCLNKKIQFLSFRNFSESELKQFHSNLNYEVASGNVQYIYEKIRYPGFFAIRKLASDLKFYRYFFWILYLPLIPLLGILFMNYLKSKKN